MANFRPTIPTLTIGRVAVYTRSQHVSMTQIWIRIELANPIVWYMINVSGVTTMKTPTIAPSLAAA